MRMIHAHVLTLGLIAGIAGTALAQSGNYVPTTLALTPAALEAHQIQGEYYGVLSNGDTLGAWVMARSNNSYALSLLPGGLTKIPGQPGGNWGGVNRYTGTATWNSGTNAYNVTTASGYATTSITGTGYDRVLNGTTAGGVAFALTRMNRKSPTLGLKPKASWSSHASLDTTISLFDSAAAAANSAGELGKWINNGVNPQLKYNYLYRGVKTKNSHGAGFLHIEVMSAFYPAATGQNRGNSGVYLHGKYEAQVLDSFGLIGAHDEMGAIYKVKVPRINSVLPPLTFQTYDIYFTPRTSGANGSAAGAAVMTVYLNGVLVQDSTVVSNYTEAGEATSQLLAGSLALQNHNNEVFYNNVWFIPVEGPALSHRELIQALPYDQVLAQAGVSSIARAPGARGSLRGASKVNGRFDLIGRRIGEKLAPQIVLPGLDR
jgi:hypothetical protein